MNLDSNKLSSRLDVKEDSTFKFIFKFKKNSDDIERALKLIKTNNGNSKTGSNFL